MQKWTVAHSGLFEQVGAFAWLGRVRSGSASATGGVAAAASDKLNVDDTNFFFRVIQPQRYHDIISHIDREFPTGGCHFEKIGFLKWVGREFVQKCFSSPA